MDDTAGSKPSRLIASGMSDPTSVPSVTTATTEIATVNAIAMATSAPLPIIARAKPATASSAPSVKPMNDSLANTRGQSRGAISPSASARMIKDDDCDPELPPDEMISGTNRIRSITSDT